MSALMKTADGLDWVNRHEREVKSLVQWSAGGLIVLAANAMSLSTFVIVTTIVIGVVTLVLAIRKVRRDQANRLVDHELELLQQVVYQTWIAPTEEIIERIDAECGPKEPTVVVPLHRINQMREVIEDHSRLEEENKAYAEAIGHLKATVRRKDEEVRDLKNAVYMQPGYMPVGLGTNMAYCEACRTTHAY